MSDENCARGFCTCLHCDCTHQNALDSACHKCSCIAFNPQSAQADPVSPASSSRAQFTSGNRVVVLESSDLLGRTGIVTRVRVNGDVMVAVIDKDAVYSFAPRALAAVGDQPPDPTEPK